MRRIGLFLVALTLVFGANTMASTINVDSLKKEIIKNSKEIQEQRKDSIAYSKLSADQILELKKGEQEVERQRIANEGSSDMPLNGFGIVLICLLPFLFVATIIFLTFRAKNAESKRRYDLYTKSLEMGQTVPEHFFDEPKKQKKSSDLKRGIICMAVGLALLVVYFVNRNSGFLIGGIIPAFIGVGYLLVHFLEKPKTDSSENDEQHG